MGVVLYGSGVICLVTLWCLTALKLSPLSLSPPTTIVASTWGKEVFFHLTVVLASQGTSVSLTMNPCHIYCHWSLAFGETNGKARLIPGTDAHLDMEEAL
ncbi:hypothetical protein Pmani_010011 [Petrolisthes manimaculis]|uniref:Uncharacterized protein n=1 Tax=Petrolisthes manimaculis TaxID=1843537 RepID=A0AAE1Q5V2_9EUCA|nr:hypothetical protein Pmani_010011 [Petrolisthes manimaculis]